MDELIERIEELTQLNTELKAANAKLEKQNLELTELAEAEAKLKAELEAMRKLNETVKAELAAMQNEYQERIRSLDAISRSAASVDPVAIEAIAKNAETLKDATEKVKSHISNYFYIYCFLVSCAIGIGGVGLYHLSKVAKNVNDILYLVLPK